MGVGRRRRRSARYRRIVLRLVGADDHEPAALSPGERAAVSRSKQAAAAGEFASAGQVRAVWAKHGL